MRIIDKIIFNFRLYYYISKYNLNAASHDITETQNFSESLLLWCPLSITQVLHRVASHYLSPVTQTVTPLTGRLPWAWWTLGMDFKAQASRVKFLKALDVPVIGVDFKVFCMVLWPFRKRVGHPSAFPRLMLINPSCGFKTVNDVSTASTLSTMLTFKRNRSLFVETPELVRNISYRIEIRTVEV